ncbi:MAG: BtpA/SgcQ family protein [Planctomycetota bacterium]|nr:BtpA/SgcQ family protein [Planctomycetota bacterium]
MAVGLLDVWRQVSCPVVGMLHLPALPGSPAFGGSWQQIESAVLRDAEALVEGGLHGLLLENYGDVPFFPGRVPREVVACMTACAVAVRRRFRLPLGINVLRNDGESALAVALASDAQFIRVNVLASARLTDQGIVDGIAHRLLRLRKSLGTEGIRILADVDVKHSAALAPSSLCDDARELVERGCADAVIVSGQATGDAICRSDLQQVREAVPAVPVWIGSGVTARQLPELLPQADGVIVGTSLKINGEVQLPVDRERVAQLMARHQELASQMPTSERS